MLSNSRQSAELLAEYKKYSHDGKLPQGLLLKTLSEIKNDVNQFLALSKIDSENEKMPVKIVQEVISRRETAKSRNLNSKTNE